MHEKEGGKGNSKKGKAGERKLGRKEGNKTAQDHISLSFFGSPCQLQECRLELVQKPQGLSLEPVHLLASLSQNHLSALGDVFREAGTEERCVHCGKVCFLGPPTDCSVTGCLAS